MSDPEEARKYRVENQQPVQGQVIGDNSTVYNIYTRKSITRRWVMVSLVIAVIIVVGSLLFHSLQPDMHPAGNTITTQKDPYLHKGTLVLNDPLTANKYGWNTVDEVIDGIPIASCGFAEQSYQVILQVQSTYQSFYCWNHAFFLQDFVYQITIKLLTNTGGGITFRLDSNTGHHFYFGINQYGQYVLSEEVGNTFKYWIKDTGDAAISRGLGKTNTLAIAAQGDQLSMYINGKPVTSAPINIKNNDKGNIGVEVGNDFPTQTPGQANYTDAKVWSLDQ